MSKWYASYPYPLANTACNNPVDGFDTANSDAGHYPPHSTDSGNHDCLDECRGSGIAIGSLDRSQSRSTPFGGDSAVELLSAVVVLWRFRAHAVQEHAERRASRIAGKLLFVLAAYVVAASALTLLGYSEPKTTYLGIAILIAAASIMPWLAKEKRKLSAVTGSGALRADAAESALCAYLSLIALVGLGVNAIWHVAWADPVAALVVTPLIVWEGREAIRGRACGCC